MRKLAFAFAAATIASVFATSAAAQQLRQAAIEDVTITPENGGINPDAFAYRIEGKILLGSNRCHAAGVTVQIKKQTIRGVVHLTPLKALPRDAGRRICAQIYAPVYKPVSLVIRGSSSRTEDIIIHNVDSIGNSERLEDLLAASAPERALTGVLTRVMAIGGETTGVALLLDDGRMIELDLKRNNLDRLLNALDGQAVAVSGQYETVHGIEIPTRQVLVVESLEATR